MAMLSMLRGEVQMIGGWRQRGERFEVRLGPLGLAAGLNYSLIPDEAKSTTLDIRLKPRQLPRR